VLVSWLQTAGRALLWGLAAANVTRGSGAIPRDLAAEIDELGRETELRVAKRPRMLGR